MKKIALILGIMLGSTNAYARTPCAQQLCAQGKIAFVQWRNQADISILFVAAGEDVRMNMRTRASSPGQWSVVGRNENPDLLVYVDPYQRNDTVKVRIVDSNSGCK